ncbi:hypothetical protein IV203_005616 [Nitzschia inconspicua]|uniref:SWIM-type domain-containing protein n=1 Tax=Nitzschia inconspicua TaxID=303405 RepID=A0A9K3KP67_9STRA|nr:hypothetical protein IV203_005616 [Nitzschia inconspicua]
MATGQRIPVEMLRRLVRPLYPPGTSLDSQLLFNIRLKIKRMLAKGDIDLTSHTVTEEDEAHLLSNTEDLDYKQSPDFLTEAFLQFRELLQESLGDQNDVQRMIHYLDKMVKCDPTFDYRIGRSADGTVTGFVWQTGVMRRDFELYGDVLFVDCMGKSINTKGWPINTIAMLDGEKKVCLPCEALIINETIDGYVWVINCILSMAPERKCRDIKFLVGDGIFAAETILTKLGIEGTCRVLLDHHHLLSLEIGSWPKAFGLNLFSLLKEDLTLMVNSPSATAYEQALEGVRSKLHNHPDQKHAQYLETHIHSKRHLFANHIVQSLPGHLNIQGNAPAEANHASIVAQVGSMVMEPVLLLESLMEWHLSICSERNHCISLRHVQCQALAVQSTDRSTIEALKGLSSTIEALKGLSSWGFKLYEKAIRHSQKLHHRKNLDGSHQFDYIDGSSTLTIEASTDVCSCPVWVATGGTTQCSHLLLLQGGFRKEKWAVRWHQRTALGKSPRIIGEEEVSVGERACGVVGEEASHREDAATSQEVTVLSRAGTVSYRGAQSGKYDLRELYHIFQELANCIHKVRDNTTKDLLVGTALKLKDVAVGNVEQVYSQPILDTLHSYLHLFGRTMAPQDMFAQVSRGISHREEDGENQYEPQAKATLKRSKPPGANGGRRYRSRNERTMDQMKESSKRAALCSICLQPGHRIVQCSKISEARATLIGHNHVAEFAAGLGDPMLCLVEEPFGSMRETIKKWMQSGRNIPVEAVHVVVQRCFYSATRQDSSRNVVEVFVLGERWHACKRALSCMPSSQQDCPVDFSKLHCQKEEEAHPVLPAET